MKFIHCIGATGRLKLKTGPTAGDQHSKECFSYKRKNLFASQRHIMLSDTMTEATVEEISGFISGNVKRKQIVDVLHKNGSKSSEDLRKITRTPKVIMEKVLKNMEENGVITKQGDSYSLTENGMIAANALPKQSAQTSVHKFDSNIRREI